MSDLEGSKVIKYISFFPTEACITLNSQTAFLLPETSSMFEHDQQVIHNVKHATKEPSFQIRKQEQKANQKKSLVHYMPRVTVINGSYLLFASLLS